MKLSDFNYHLPKELIAQEALAERAASRLLVVEPELSAIEPSAIEPSAIESLTIKSPAAKLSDQHFGDIVDLIDSLDLLVFNNTRVIPARLLGHKQSGGKVEVMMERILDEHRVIAHVRANKSPRAGNLLYLENDLDTKLEAKVIGRHDTLFEIVFLSEQPVLELLEQYGHIPLPPYIERADTEADRERYQTVFAQHPGAVAAPTAGLHFTDELLKLLDQKGVSTAEVTLHVGAGTFLPVRVENLDEHIMHAEWVEVNQGVCDAVLACKARGGKVVAVGTTTVRSLESAAKAGSGTLIPFSGDTQLFIRPGYPFKVVDAMITNFHLPESTLMMLVSAFSGYENILAAYRHAVSEKYRFFSYGDAMFLRRE